MHQDVRSSRDSQPEGDRHGRGREQVEEPTLSVVILTPKTFAKIRRTVGALALDDLGVQMELAIVASRPAEVRAESRNSL